MSTAQEWDALMADYLAEMRAAGERIPARWGAKGYKELETSDGVAYTFTLTDNGTPVASVENSGRGGADLIHWQGGFRSEAAEAFVADGKAVFGEGDRQDSMVSAILLRAGF